MADIGIKRSRDAAGLEPTGGEPEKGRFVSTRYFLQLLAFFTRFGDLVAVPDRDWQVQSACQFCVTLVCNDHIHILTCLCYRRQFQEAQAGPGLRR